MGNGDFGYRPPRFRLMNEQLHLDPEITRTIQEIEARMAARQMVNQFLQPDWQLLMPTWQSILARPNKEVRFVAFALIQLASTAC